MTRYAQEWQHRKVVMEAILEVLQDGKPRTARQILLRLPTDEGFKVNKRLVNSILFSEAKRYVIYNRNSYTYRMRPADEPVIDLPPWDLVRRRAASILRAFGPQSVNALVDILEDDGLYVPKWMVRQILTNDEFQFTTASTPQQRGTERRNIDELISEALGEFV